MLGNLIMIDPWKTDQYYARLKSIRKGQFDATQKLKEVKDPFSIHPQHTKLIPSFLKAENNAQKGEIYCWLCGSNHVIKGGHKEKKYVENFSFNCKDCKNGFTYRMDKKIYDSFKGFKMKKGQKIKYY